jgi:chemotaxis protein methyltransferase CheR
LRDQSSCRQEGSGAGPPGQAASRGRLPDVLGLHRTCAEGPDGQGVLHPYRFREHEHDEVLPHFEFLSRRFLPRLLEAKRNRGRLRLRGWSAGCSSGEEPYSLAITLLEAIGGQSRWDVKLLATDVSTRMLERARRGRYDQQRIEPIPPLLRDRYLIHRNATGEDAYEVRDLLRSVVILRYLNLMRDWPIKGPIDFIFCCNVMIYFDKLTQERLVQRFYDLLAPGGMLFTGHSESLTGVRHAFRYVQPTIYEKQ